MFFSFAKIHLFFEMVIKTFLVSLFDQRDYIFILIYPIFAIIFAQRLKAISNVLEFYVYA